MLIRPHIERIGILMDTTKGELSFFMNGVNYGTAYEGIPLDKPLVPCALLSFGGDSVKLDTFEVKENVNKSIPVPSNITVKSTTWDSVTLAWNGICEVSLFYQVEVDGRMSTLFKERSFIKKGLLPETEYSFRVRAVKWEKSE